MPANWVFRRREVIEREITVHGGVDCATVTRAHHPGNLDERWHALSAVPVVELPLMRGSYVHLAQQ